MLFTLMMAFLFAGCGPRYVDYFPFHDDGTPKPRVALLPILNNTPDCVPWDISSEINAGIRYKGMCHGHLFLLSDNEIASHMQGIGPIDYFGVDISNFKKICDADYVVAMELVGHEVYCSDQCDLSHIPLQKYRWKSVLEMKVRLRIVDVKCSKPRIVLQEVLTCNYAIPLGREYMDYTRCGWGNSAFFETPCGMAHERLISDLVCRMETVITRP